MTRTTRNSLTAGLIVWALFLAAMPFLPHTRGTTCDDATICSMEPPLYVHTGNWTQIASRSNGTEAYVRELRRR